MCNPIGKKKRARKTFPRELCEIPTTCTHVCTARDDYDDGETVKNTSAHIFMGARVSFLWNSISLHCTTVCVIGVGRGCNIRAFRLFFTGHFVKYVEIERKKNYVHNALLAQLYNIFIIRGKRVLYRLRAYRVIFFYFSYFLRDRKQLKN